MADSKKTKAKEVKEVSKKEEAKDKPKKNHGPKEGGWTKEGMCSALMYIPPYGLLWYLLDEERQESSFTRFHLKQGLLILFMMAVIGILSLIVFVGWVLAIILAVCMIILAIVGIVNSITGHKTILPVVGEYEDRFKFKF